MTDANKYLENFLNDLYANRKAVLRKLEDYPKRSRVLKNVLENATEDFEIPKDENTCKEIVDFIFWYSLGVEVESSVKMKESK